MAAPFSFLPETTGNIAWTAVTVVILAALVRVCFGPLLRRFGRAGPIALVLVVAAVGALSPVEDHLRFGQVGIPLMACCVFDCMTEKPRWPRGLLIGIATAVKLVPGIFIPYLWLSGRRRAAGVAVATFGACTLLGFIVTPGDSWDFFHSKMFQPTSPTFFTNQSLEGILQRAIGGPWRVVWIVAVVAVLVYGLRAAVGASRAGDELRAVAITGLVSVLVSPISWIHHLVWVVPALAVIVGPGRDRKQVAIAFVFAALFVGRLPYFGHDELKTGFLAAVLQDSFGFLCIALLVYLARRHPRPGSSRSARRRLLQERRLRDRPDRVGTAAVTGDDVLGAIDRHLRTQHLPEQGELGTAQARARGGRGADRAVVLDEQDTPTVGIVDDLGDVTLGRADVCERVDTGAQRGALRAPRARSVARCASARASITSSQTLVAERRAHRGDELDGEVVVAIGEQVLGEIGERPDRRRPAAPRGGAGAGDDEAVLGERIEVLAHPGLGHVERAARSETLASARFRRSTIRRLVGPEVRLVEVLTQVRVGPATGNRRARLDVVHRALDYRNRTLAESRLPEGRRRKGRP